MLSARCGMHNGCKHEQTCGQEVCFEFLVFPEISSRTLFAPQPPHTHLVSEVGLRSCPVVRGSQPLNDSRVVDADLMTPTQCILLRPDHIWADQVSDQPP